MVSPDVGEFDAPTSGLTRTSFVSDSTSNSFYHFNVNSDNVVVTEQSPLQEILGTSIEYSEGYWYYAIGTKQNDDSITYEWKKSNEFIYDINGNLTGAIPFDSGYVKAGETLIKYFKVAVFVNAQIQTTGTNQNSWSAESSRILYRLAAEQEEA